MISIVKSSAMDLKDCVNSLEAYRRAAHEKGPASMLGRAFECPLWIQ
jgi:hypothetical protein